MNRKQSSNSRLSQLVLLAALLFSICNCQLVRAEENEELDLDSADVIGQNLESLEGQTVTLKVQSGEDLTGIVAAVGRSGVRIKKLAGKELFDAIIRLDRINAILIRSDALQKPKDAKDAKE